MERKRKYIQETNSIPHKSYLYKQPLLLSRPTRLQNPFSPVSWTSAAEPPYEPLPFSLAPGITVHMTAPPVVLSVGTGPWSAAARDRLDDGRLQARTVICQNIGMFTVVWGLGHLVSHRVIPREFYPDVCLSFRSRIQSDYSSSSLSVTSEYGPHSVLWSFLLCSRPGEALDFPPSDGG